MKIKEITNYLESLAPLAYQESYDNCGLLVGSDQTEMTKVLVTLDCTEEIIEEAIANGCNFIIAHHPIIFGGLKKINGKNYVERTVIKAIQNNIAIYAIHTNLDNVLGGVSSKIADRLGLNQTQILDNKSGLLQKLVVFVPNEHLEKVRNALFEAGAGEIGAYEKCSFVSTGMGSFQATKGANPFVGEIDQLHFEPESKLEVIYPKAIETNVISALKTNHPYEEVAYDLFSIQNNFSQVGSGIIGFLPEPLNEAEFLGYLKEKMELKAIRFTRFNSKKISKVAVCGGAGSFLLQKAIASGADAFVSADFKYHEFFDAENRLLIADIGHYESEKFTKSLICELILKKFPTFAILLSKTDTNPINYYS
jgi:dinuclear metal center YbgI/SA1388 family protein